MQDAVVIIKSYRFDINLEHRYDVCIILRYDVCIILRCDVCTIDRCNVWICTHHCNHWNVGMSLIPHVIEETLFHCNVWMNEYNIVMTYRKRLMASYCSVIMASFKAHQFVKVEHNFCQYISIVFVTSYF